MRRSNTRVLVLAGLVLGLGALMGWASLFIPGGAPSVVIAQTKGKEALETARAALNRAIGNEKANPTKESALAADEALDAYNAAVAVRVAEINAALSQLRASGSKSPLVAQQIAALEAELREIQPPSSPTPVVNPETEPNNTSATANAIDLSATAQPCAIVSGAINPGGDLDFFTFTGAPAGSRIWIETDTGGAQNAGATSRDTVIDLLAADGTTVIENDDDDGVGNGGDGTTETGLASIIGGRTLTAGGTYFIKVRAFSATAIINPYRLFVTLTNVAPTAEVEANNTAATANSLVAAGTPIGLRSGAIGSAGDADYYSCAVTAGNILYVNVDADPERDGTGTDLVVEFRDPADVLLLSVDSSITGSVSNPAAEGANFTIGTSGTYFIRVRHFSATGTGTYHIMASACSSDPLSGGGACTVITCPANVTQTNDPNQCGAVVSYPAPTPSGDCGTITCAPASGSFFPVGTTTVTCTSTAGPTCMFTVTVTDDQPPTITCPANITTSNDPNQCGAVVNYPAPTITDNCPGTFTATCIPASGSFFPVGTTTVDCQVNPPARAAVASPQGGCTTITQSTSQAIVDNNSVSCNNGVGHTDNSYWRAFSLPTFGILGAFDVQSVDIGVELALAGGARPSPGKPSIGPNKSGATKGKGTTAPGGTGQPLTVRLYTSSSAFPSGFPGSLTMIGSTSISVADQADTILNIPVTGTAAAGSQLVVEVFTPDGEVAGNLFFIGSNTAPETGPSYLSAADCGVTTPTTTTAIGFPSMHIVMNVNGCEQGGSACSFTVTVQDTQPPTITCPANVTAVTDQNACPAPACVTVNYPAPTFTDNCPGTVVACTPPAGSCLPTGVTTVTCTATDASGNTATCSFTVTVFDTALQDDSDPSIVLLWNSITGAYRFCCKGTVYTGVGKATRQGCVYTLDHTGAPDRRVLGRVDKATHSGSGSLQAPPGTTRCVIQDRNTLNDNPMCQ